MKKLKMNNNFYKDIQAIIETARNKAYKAVNFTMVEAYWAVGKRIVEEEQKGSKRAGYGEYLLIGILHLTSQKVLFSCLIASNAQFYPNYPELSTRKLSKLPLLC